MSIALVINQPVSAIMFRIFLSVVSCHGYSTMLFIFGRFTAANFLVTVFLLPEIKRKAREEIEQRFERPVRQLK